MRSDQSPLEAAEGIVSGLYRAGLEEDRTAEKVSDVRLPMSSKPQAGGLEQLLERSTDFGSLEEVDGGAIVSDERDEKFLKLRNGIWEHFSEEGLQPTEFVVYLRLMSLVDLRTGQVRTTVAHLSAELNGVFKPITVKKALLALEQKGYIHRQLEKLATGMWTITINKFEIVVGSKAGTRIEIPATSLSAERVDPSGRYHNNDITSQVVTTITTYPARSLSTELPSRTGSSYNNDLSHLRDFSGNDINDLRALRIEQEKEQEADSDGPASFSPSLTTANGTEIKPGTNGDSARSPLAPSPSPRGTITNPASRQTGFIPPHLRANPATAKPKPVPQQERVSPLDGLPIPDWMPLSHPLKNTDADFDALDWVFSLPLNEPVNGMDPAEMRRAAYWHWYREPKQFWRKQTIPTIVRLTAALPTMISQVPKDFRKKVNGGWIPYRDPNCEKCKGTGILGIVKIPKADPDAMFVPEQTVRCDCDRLHPYPWRIERKNEE
jgi:hypothetical protein